ncbi:hypothetical protein L6452_35839 [Arctium lappa]|uniref:Uncharacterized protein n=1 Tax=Arctium lappa TaxID=4217 RepID=A0ACB8Y6V0_ARCLA|nr:hypothetical protein L6452_35839 [Arctium lappa]
MAAGSLGRDRVKRVTHGYLLTGLLAEDGIDRRLRCRKGSDRGTNQPKVNYPKSNRSKKLPKIVVAESQAPRGVGPTVERFGR